MRDRRARLARLFEETGGAHHQAYIESDGEDAEWPLWYAGYLEGRIGELLGEQPTRSELVYHVLAAARAQEAEAPDQPWPGYYADYFVEQFPA